MKHPTCKIGHWNIKYIQIPYEDRYIITTYKNNITGSKVECKIQFDCFINDLQCLSLPFDLHSLINDSTYLKRWVRFLKRVEKYNKFLDK